MKKNKKNNIVFINGFIIPTIILNQIQSSMKTTIIFVILFLISAIGFTQINLEHTFTSTIGSTTYVNTNNQTMYYLHDGTSHVLTLYNHDYSIYKIITITPPTGYQFSASFNLAGGISTKVFNTDDLVEFAYVFQSTGTPVTYKLLLYNENLQVVKDFGSRAAIYIFQTVNDGLKCSVLGVTQDPNPPYAITYYNDIYSLPGSLPLNVIEQIPTENELKPYPNPSFSTITIPVTLEANETSILKIFNQNGQLIDSKKIDKGEKSIKYDVKGLNPGLYFYQYDNFKEKFIVTK